MSSKNIGAFPFSLCTIFLDECIQAEGERPGLFLSSQAGRLQGRIAVTVLNVFYRGGKENDSLEGSFHSLLMSGWINSGYPDLYLP